MQEATTNGVTTTNGTSAPNDDHNADLDIFGDPEAHKRPVSQESYNQAVQTIKTKLPALAELPALFSIDLGGHHPHVIIDARKEPVVILDKTDETPVSRVQIRPETIARIIEGQMEPRYGVNMGHIIAHGLPHIAVKFGDYISPKHLQPLSPAAAGADLPVPTEDLGQVWNDLKKHGYGLIKNALKPEQLAALKKRAKAQADGEKKAGIAFFDGGPKKPNQRVWNLPNKGKEFLDLLEHPIIDEFIPEMLGDGFVISSYTANIARPGGKPMFMHYDQLPINPPIREVTLGVNIAWFLEDVTEENGGTRILPGSHRGRVAPDDLFDTTGTVAAEGPAGTALIFDSRLWHCTGANNAPSGERPVLLLFFVRYFVRPQENFFLSLTPGAEEGLSDRVKSMLGYRVTGTLGGVEGFNHDGTIVHRLKNPVGVLEP